MKLLRLWQSVTIAVVVIAFLAVPAFAVPVEGVFVLIPDGTVEYSTGPIFDDYPYPDVGSGEDWGKAEVKYWYWQDAEDGWHYYTYQIINNTVTSSDGDESNPPDAYHFGWFSNIAFGGGDPGEGHYLGIYMLSIVGFGAQSPTGDGPGDLVVTGFGGSSGGGNAWDDKFPDPNNTGLDWENKTGLQVDPARWFWDDKDTGPKSDDEWTIIPGETSTTNPYFQIASMWGPDWCTAEIVVSGSYTADETDVQLLAYGEVKGPVIIPEPATCLLFALGGLALVSKRRRTR